MKHFHISRTTIPTWKLAKVGLVNFNYKIDCSFYKGYRLECFYDFVMTAQQS